MIKLERVADWESHLSEYIASKRDEPFCYAVNDCFCFSFGAVQAMTGVDGMLEFRGQYSNEFGSLRALKEIGQGDLESTLDYKFPVIEIGQAQRGDLAFFDGSVGVVMGEFAWFVAEQGLERVPMSFWDKCWKVG